MGRFIYQGYMKGENEMNDNMDFTMKFETKKEEEVMDEKSVIMYVFDALKEKGYNPVNQLVGYILSGDPTYITSHKNARTVIRKYERDELLETIIKDYLKEK